MNKAKAQKFEWEYDMKNEGAIEWIYMYIAGEK
jgi:hypothetical protein